MHPYGVARRPAWTNAVALVVFLCGHASCNVMSGGARQHHNLQQLRDQVLAHQDITSHIVDQRIEFQTVARDVDIVQDLCPHQCQLARHRRRQIVDLLHRKVCAGDVDYVIVAVVTNISDQHYTVDVQAVFKLRYISIKTKQLQILRTDRLNVDTAPLPRRCACPWLTLGKRYLLSGREYIAEHTLTLGPADVVMRWKSRWQRSIESSLVACATSGTAISNAFRTSQSAHGDSALVNDESWEKR